MFSNALWMFIVNVSSRYLENVIAWNDTEWPKIDPVTLDKNLRDIVSQLETEYTTRITCPSPLPFIDFTSKKICKHLESAGEYPRDRHVQHAENASRKRACD